MRVRLLFPYTTQNDKGKKLDYIPGEVADLPDEEALRLQGKGKAEIIEGVETPAEKKADKSYEKAKAELAKREAELGKKASEIEAKEKELSQRESELVKKMEELETLEAELQAKAEELAKDEKDGRAKKDKDEE